MIVISIPNYPVFSQKFRSRSLPSICVLFLWRKPVANEFLCEYFNPRIPFRDISSFRKEIVFYFARLISKFLTVGRSWSGSFTPPYRSVVTRCAAISLESPLFHRDWARCSRAENGARCEKQVTRPLDMANAFQRERKCTRTLCTRCFAHGSFVVDSLAFAIAFFFFSFFERRKETNFQCLSVFKSVWRCLSSYNR